MAKCIIIFFFSAFSMLSFSMGSSCNQKDASISIRYLGVSALDINYKHHRVLTDPFYSPQTLGKIFSIDKYRPNPSAIKAALGEYQKDVDNVLIGHGHYDHLADLPAIKNYLKEDALILGSPSSNNMIAPIIEEKNRKALTSNDMNKWIYIADGWIRVKPQASEHAPQFMGLNFAPSKVTVPRTKLPRYTWSWKQGQNLTYMVDFLSTQNSEHIFKRIFIQTSASDFPVGFQELEDDKQVDAIFVAAASFDNVDNYPTGIMSSYQSANTYLIHWEDFFNPWMTNPDILSNVDFDEIKLRAKDKYQGNINIPQPKDCIYF